MTLFSKFRSGRKSRKTENSEDATDNVVPNAASSTASVPHQAQTSTTGPASQSSPGQAAFASSTPDTPPSSLHLDPATQQNTTEVALPRPKEELDLWARAYEILQAREPGLVSDFAKHLASLHGDSDPLSPRSIQSIVTRLLDDRDKKQWRVSLLGKDVKIREQAEKMVKFLIWSDSIVSAVVSSQPYAALAWSGVSLLLPLLSSGVAANVSMLKGFNSLGDVQVYWQIVEKTYLQPARRKDYEELLEPIAKLYSHILEYQARVICHLSRAQLSRAWENVAGWNNWDGKVAEIESLSQRFSGYISPLEAEEIRKSRDMELQKMQESQTILDEIRVILEASRRDTMKLSDDEKQRDLLQDLASDYQSYKDFNPPRVQGTCEWFLADDRFLEWRSSDSGLLWVSAGPGCGKSVLSRALIDERRLSTNVATSTVCYYFFKDGDENRMYATNALCAILHQLFTHAPTSGLIEHALPSHKNYGKSLTGNFPELWRILMNCVKSPEAGEIVCVLDALDECHPDGRQKLINKLREFYHQHSQSSGLQPRLKFLITSRPYDDLAASFNRFSRIMTYVRFDGDDKASQISDEINLVIDAKVDEIAYDFDEDDRRRIAEQLKGMENRTYLWLHLTFDIIEQSPSEYGRLSDIEALLSGLPSEVSEAYEKILQRSKNELHTQTLLEIVLAAARPLTLDEANVALTLALKKGRFDSYAALESSMWPRGKFENIVKNLCGHFISVHESTLSFIHQTAREFLIHPEKKGRWQGRLDMTKAHGRMAMICMEYLSYVDEPIPVSEDRMPLAQYSAQYWTDHAKAAETEEDVQESILDFFLHQDQAYRVWGLLFDPELSVVPYLRENKPMAAPLYYAVVCGLLRTAGLLLKEGVDVNAQGGEHGNALQAASARGYENLVRLLLERGADVNAQGGAYGNALFAASAEGHATIARLLLEAGADINLRNHYDATPLQAAIREGHSEVVKLLLECGADVNAEGSTYYGTPLDSACQNGDKEVVQLLLERDVDTRAGHPLLAACYSGDIELVRLLLEKDVDVNVKFRAENPLLVASARGDADIVQLLLDKGADINARGVYGNALQLASYEGHKEVVQLLIEEGIDINAEYGEHGTALRAASYQGHKEIVQILLERGANVNANGGWYDNALSAAARGGHTEVVRMLLDRDVDANVQGGVFINALEGATSSGHKEVVKLLVERGAEGNAHGGHYGNVLVSACAGNMNTLETVQLLLECGIDVNSQADDHRTALQTASAYGDQKLVQLLLSKGAVDIQGGPYGSALIAACHFGFKEIIQLLLEHGADPNIQGDQYGTALQAAASRDDMDIEVLQMLLEHGADVNAQGGKFGTALQAAAHRDNMDMEVVQMLLDHGADVNAQGGKFGTALQAASHRGHTEVVKALLERGADVDAQGGIYGTALQAASVRGHMEVVELLLEKDADVNAQGGEYGTALQAACNEGNMEIVQLLLERGADVNAQGGPYGTALQAACYEGNIEIVQLLLERGADVNAQGGLYGSALQAAHETARTDIVNLLVENGAVANAQDGE